MKTSLRIDIDKGLYDEICKALTWYEHKEECPFEDKGVSDLMYELLVRVINKCEQ